MSQSRLRAGQRAIAVAATGILAATVGASPFTAHAQSAPTHRAASSNTESLVDKSYTNGSYIVLMAGQPAVAYTGGVSGLRETAPSKGDSFDADTKAAAAYKDYLTGRQDSLAAKVGATPFYNYSTSLDGFAAKLTADQATTLARQPGVTAVVPDEMRHLDTWQTPSFLGLSGTFGVWRRLGGSNSTNGAGSGTVVGVIDSGINHDSPSFDAVGSPPPDTYTGTCETGRADDAGTFACNDKLIGGRFYTEGQGGDDAIFSGEFLSPEDFNGHGSHTSSTAAGNNGVPAVVDGIDFGTVSGMAPAAKVAAYKVCWQNEAGDDSCATSDSVAAIDQAVTDGVDVLNYSISGAQDTVLDAVEIAFMYAADAGVFVATSAGNSGPTESTVAHPSPWLTSTAAATHVKFESTLLLGDGTRMIGASIDPNGLGVKPLVYAGDIPAAGAAQADAALCFPDSVDPAGANGNIVICDRGVNPRVEKGQVVADAGGVGMVLVNVDPAGVAADIQPIPTVHLESNYRDELLTYAETTNPTASILAGENTGSTSPEPPAIAGFSSRGPSLAADGDLLKPDITAPGVDVLAAVTPENNSGRDYDLYSGTSMSSPHIAGLAALIMQRYPKWSPMQVKSAMMTTATNLTDTRNPFDQGAGFVRPRAFLEPGLVYNSDFGDWANFLTGQGLPLTDTPLKASQVNLPSIAVNKMAGRETVTRTVTNVDDQAATYTASTEGLHGLKTTVTPSTLSVPPHKSRTFTVTFERKKADFDAYTTGSLYWEDGSHIVRSPVVVQPVGVDAPAEVQVSGSRKIATKSGFDGTMGHRVRGLAAGVDTAAEAQNSHQASDPRFDGNYFQRVKIGGPQQVLRVQTLPQFAGDDLDLYLLDSSGNPVAQSATGRADETITVNGLPAGAYRISVEAWAVHDNVPSTTFDVRTFKVGKSRGNLTVSSKTQRVQIGKKYTWRASTSGLDSGTPYLGNIEWTQVQSGRDEAVGSTLVSVN